MKKQLYKQKYRKKNFGETIQMKFVNYIGDRMEFYLQR